MLMHFLSVEQKQATSASTGVNGGRSNPNSRFPVGIANGGFPAT